MQKRYLVVIGGGILIVAMVALALPLLRSLDGGSVSAQNQQTARVERTTLTSTIETTGSIAPEETMLLAFGTSGRVDELLVDVGDEVKQGDVLARLDTTDLENQIARQEQSVIVQQSSYDQLISPATDVEIAQAEASLASAESQLTQAQSNLDAASNNETINCSSLDSAELELERAQEAYDDYVNEGYQMDANFIPDPDSETGERLRDAQSSYDVSLAQCDKTTPISQLEAAVTAAEASVNQAQSALDDLMNGPTTEQITSSQAQLDSAQLQLEDAKAALDDAVILAPFDGMVSDVNITLGQLVNTSTTAMTLVDYSQLHIDVSLDELDIVQIEVGQPATIIPEALDTLEIEGTVVRIAPTSTTIDGVVTYEVRVDINHEETLPIRIGMTTDVEIVVGTLGDVLVVPTDAVQRDGENEYVEVLNADNSTTQVPVITGDTIDDTTVVEGDLTEGTTVVIPQATTTSSSLFAPPGGN